MPFKILKNWVLNIFYYCNVQDVEDLGPSKYSRI